MSQLKPFVVIEELRVVFQCDKLGEGLAFIQGRGAGVLSRVLTNEPEKKQRDEQPKSRTRGKKSQPRRNRAA